MFLSDFLLTVFKGRVTRQRMASLFREVRFQLEQVWQVGEDFLTPSYSLTVTVTGSRAHCPCPEFEVGGTYIVFARYQDSWERWTLSRHSTVRPYTYATDYMIRYFMYQCSLNSINPTPVN